MSAWMYWLAVGIAIFVAEIFSGSVYLLVIAAAFMGTALASFLGVGTTGSILIASILTAIGITFVYRWKRDKSNRTKLSNSDDLDIGQYVVIEEHLPNKSWRVNYRGAVWEAHAKEHVFKTGDAAKIIGKEGIILLIEPV